MNATNQHIFPYFRSILVKICEVIPVNQQRHQRRLQTKKLLNRKKKSIFNFFIYINYIKIREINLFILDIFQKKFFVEYTGILNQFHENFTPYLLAFFHCS